MKEYLETVTRLHEHKPNIILIILDAVRYDHLSCYGYWRPTTPNLDRIAERGILFENCFAAAHWTPPSHASLFTSKYPSQCGVLGKNQILDGTHLTMAEFLCRQGYRTGGTGSAWISRNRGFDYGFEEFVEQWRRPSWQHIPLLKYKIFQKVRDWILRSNDGGDYVVLQWFKRWAEKTYKQGPFFAFLRFLSAHSPYYPLPHFRRRFEPPLNTEDDLRRLRHLANLGGYSFMAGESVVSEREWEVLKAWYDSCILYMDSLIGQMIDWLQQRDLLESTLLIITADHGENFGEHGLAYHVYCVYDTLLHVPLIMAGPKDIMPAGERIEDLVSLVDIFPSIVHLTEPDAPFRADLAGKSIFPLDGFPIRDRVFAECGLPYNLRVFERLHPDFSAEVFDKAFKCVRTASHKYILTSDGASELYDIQRDPGETANVVEQFPQLAAELQASLQDTLGVFSGTSAMETQEVMTLEEEERLAAHLRALGYF